MNTIEPLPIFFDTEYINTLRLNENEIIKKNLNYEIINYRWLDKYLTKYYKRPIYKKKEDMLKYFNNGHYEHKIINSWNDDNELKKFTFTNLKSVNNPTNKGCFYTCGYTDRKLYKDELIEWAKLNNIKCKKSLKYKDIVLLLWKKFNELN